MPYTVFEESFADDKKTMGFIEPLQVSLSTDPDGLNTAFIPVETRAAVNRAPQQCMAQPFATPREVHDDAAD